MTDDEHQPAIPGIAQPETIRMRMEVHPVTIAMTSPLWYWWAQIAIRQERRTWAVRRTGLAALANDDLDHLRAKLLNDETLEAIQAVAAVRHSIHNLYRTWANTLGLPIDPDDPRRTQEHKVTLARITSAPHTSDEAGAWRTRVKDLIGDRDGAVHHDEGSDQVQPHPAYPTNVSGMTATFTAERATQAVDVLLNDVIRRVVEAPSAALSEWATKRGKLLPGLDDIRGGAIPDPLADGL